MLSKLKQAIPIKYFMVAYLGALISVSALLMRQPMFLLKAALMVALYTSFDLAWTRLRDHVWYLPVSSWISGLVLSIVAIPNPPLLLAIALPFLAVASKQVLHFGKPRHVFNPASFAITCVALFTPAAGWWAVSWGMPVMAVVALIGLFILWRQSRWHVTLTFLVVYVVMTAVLGLLGGLKIAALSIVLKTLVFQGTVVFFSTVMLIEPITTSFPTRKARMIYAALVGAIAPLASLGLGYVPLPYVDPLIVGLLSGNLIASMMFLKPKLKPVAAAAPVAPPAASVTP